MSNSDHEDFELSSSIVDFSDCKWEDQDPGWGKNIRERRHRRYTMSHVAPPAPPSTPTLLTTTAVASMSMTTPINGTCSGSGSGIVVSGDISPTITPDNNRLNHFIYVASTKALRSESRCTESELAELLNVVSITNRLTTNNSTNGIKNKSNKQLAERGVRNASRAISKLKKATKIFKIHRDPKEFFREPDEDSVSAPEEYDTEEEDTRCRHFCRYKFKRRYLQARRERKFARFEHQEQMETIVDGFDAALSFNDA